MILRLYIVDKIHRNVIKAVVSNTRQWNLPWMDDLMLPAVVYFFKLYYLKKHVIYLSHPNQAIASFLFQFRFELSWGKKIECLSLSVRQSFNVKLRFFLLLLPWYDSRERRNFLIIRRIHVYTWNRQYANLVLLSQQN